MKRQYFGTILLTLAVLALCIITQMGKQTSNKIKVALIPNNGIRILSENPIYLDKGQDASFQVEILEDYFYRDNDTFSYKDGVITFKNVTREGNLYADLGHFCQLHLGEVKNGTIEILTEGKVENGKHASVRVNPDEHFQAELVYINNRPYPVPKDGVVDFEVFDDSEICAEFLGEPMNFMTMCNNLGEVVNGSDIEQYRYGDELQLDCTLSSDSVVFKGWSEDGYLKEGGTLVSKDSKYTYRLEKDTLLFANFEDINKYYVRIDDEIEIECDPETYMNLPVDNNTISKDGYVLIGYNTKEDGSGISYSLGARMQMPREDVQLYASWAKCTEASNFRVDDEGDTVSVLGYSSSTSEDTICIPTRINGKKVTSIASGAFKNCSNIKTVIIPNGVTSISDSAFWGCSALTTVYLPETLTSLSAEAFANTPSFENLRVLASLGRAFDYDYDSAMADKYMRLKNVTGKKLIVVGGSSVTFGLSSTKLQAKYPDYEVVNFSCSFLYGIIPLFDMLEANVHEGDVIVLAPEYYQTMYANSQSSTIANWQYLESNYDILSDINISHCSNLLTTYVKYLESKRRYLPGKLMNSDSVYVRSGMNLYGDLIVYRENKGIFYPEIPDSSLVTSEGMGRYNEICKKLSDKGASCLFSFPPMSNGGSSKTIIAERGKTFVEALDAKLDGKYCTRISAFEDYGFDPDLFYDNMYHLTRKGAEIRTEQLIKDLEEWGKMK